MRNHLIRASAQKRIPKYISQTSSLTDSTSYSFSMGIGTAFPDRYVLACVATRYAGSGIDNYPTVTVGGVSTTRLTGVSENGSGTIIIGMYVTSSKIASGTTATVAVTAPSGLTMSRSLVAIYSLVADTATPKSTSKMTFGEYGAAASITKTFTSTKNTNQSELILAISGTNDNQQTTITGSANLAFDYTTLYTEFTGLRSGLLTSSGSYSVTVTESGTAPYIAVCSAVF